MIILKMVSYYQIKPQQVSQIIHTFRSEMIVDTKEKVEVRRKFDLSSKERDMLEELKNILEAFEFFTDELQRNRVNISRVYLGVIFLKEKLKPDGAIYILFSLVLEKQV